MNIFVPLLIGAVDMAKKQQGKIDLSSLIKIHTLEGKNQIDLLKSRMNRNRTIMDWKHLDKY